MLSFYLRFENFQILSLTIIVKDISRIREQTLKSYQVDLPGSSLGNRMSQNMLPSADATPSRSGLLCVSRVVEGSFSSSNSSTGEKLTLGFLIVSVRNCCSENIKFKIQAMLLHYRDRLKKCIIQDLFRFRSYEIARKHLSNLLLCSYELFGNLVTVFQYN